MGVNILMMILMMVSITAMACAYTILRYRNIVLYCGGNWKKRRYKLSAVLLVLVMAALCINIWSTSAVIVLHFLVFSIVLDLLFFLIHKFYRKEQPGRFYRLLNGSYQFEILSLLLVLFVLFLGYQKINKIQETRYELTTDKEISDYTFAFLSDIHYDTIQNPALVKDAAQKISQKYPDFVILGGDIVEEDTSNASMKELFQILGNIKTKYGIFFVYGNHDRQSYSNARTFTNAELEQALTENGIVSLTDSHVNIQEDLVLAGREDAGWGNASGRKSSKEILADVDQEKYIIMVDHQPIEAEENDAAGVDLELSGHTHAGQIWPVGHLSELTGVLNYGQYQKGDCTVITSSGVAGWGYSVRTEEACEYEMIHIASN